MRDLVIPAGATRPDAALEPTSVPAMARLASLGEAGSRRTFIVWARDGRHTELLAKQLNASVHFVHWGGRNSAIKAPFRYLVQALQTWQRLRRERPRVVLVQNPPIFAVLVALLYSRVYGAQYVIGSHSGAFVSSKWRWSVGLHRALSRRAAMTIVHNRDVEALASDWGCRVRVVAFIPGNYPTNGSFAFDEGSFNVAVVSSMDEDEPVDVVFAAAARLPDVNFYVTGALDRLPERIREKKPDNLRLTGYLPYEQYVALLRGADAVMDLTTKDHTVLMGGFEAISLGTPLITSNWPVLRDYFSPGAVHVANTVEGVCDGVRQARRELADLQQGILVLRERLEREWARDLSELNRLLA